MIKKALKTTYLGLTSLLFVSTPIVLVSNISINKNYQPTTSINKSASSDGLKLETLDDLNNANPSEVAKLSSYDGRKFNITTPVKSQSEGNCWAYAVTGAMETSILKQKLLPEYTNQTLDLNEKNVDWVTKQRNSDADPLGLTKEDTLNKNLGEGGYVSNATNSLLQWNAPIAETTPYNTINDSLVTLKNSFYMNYFSTYTNDSVINKVKEMVVKYGAVAFSFLIRGTLGTHYNYNSNNGSFVGPHAGVIVGWDDTIKKDKYSPTSDYDGGWIVKNSWGPGANNNGYFYLSYDSDLTELCAYEFANKNEYENNYYYDGKTNEPYTTAKTIFKNNDLGVIFPVLKASNKVSEKLKAINISTYGDDVTANIKIYTGVSANRNDRMSEVNDPSSGTLKTSFTKTLSHPGIHTIDLEEPIILKPGENFSIVVSVSNKNGDAAIMLSKENNSTNDLTYYHKNGKWNSTSQSRLIDSDPYDNLVPRIKAFTTTETISTPEPTPPTTPEQPKPPISTPEEPEIPPTTEPEEPTNPSPSPDDEEIKSDVVISKQPETSQEIQTDKNEGIDLAIEAKSNQGKQLKYQWYENKGDGWKSIEGATNSTYNIPSTELQSVKTETTWQYRAEIQYNDGTNAKITSEIYSIKVKPTTTINPSDDAVADDTTTKTSRYLSIPAIVGISVGGIGAITIIGSSIYFAKKRKK